MYKPTPRNTCFLGELAFASSLRRRVKGLKNLNWTLSRVAHVSRPLDSFGVVISVEGQSYHSPNRALTPCGCSAEFLSSVEMLAFNRTVAYAVSS